MKYMKVKEKYGMMNLQIFAGEGGDDSGEGDDQDDDSDDSDDNSDDNGEDEKKFTQKDVDTAVKKRLDRERRKWNKQQARREKDGDGTGKDSEEDSEDSKARKEAEDRASKAEEKLACFEAGVAKDSVDDVAALARAYMANNEELDLEDAIERVLKKYPHFKNDAREFNDDESGNKSWGQRQSSKGGKKLSGVEKEFFEMNPDLKE